MKREKHPSEIRIEAAREVLKPEPVELHHIPNWLRRRMLKAFGCPRYLSSGFYVLQHAVKVCSGEWPSRWLDHFGTSKRGDRKTFVSEPYGISLSAMKSIELFAEKCGLEWNISSNSWWNPGETIRIEFWEKKDEPIKP